LEQLEQSAKSTGGYTNIWEKLSSDKECTAKHRIHAILATNDDGGDIFFGLAAWNRLEGIPAEKKIYFLFEIGLYSILMNTGRELQDIL
jgi:hypothetical protein